jgi:hypothetical protein
MKWLVFWAVFIIVWAIIFAQLGIERAMRKSRKDRLDVIIENVIIAIGAGGFLWTFTNLP